MTEMIVCDVCEGKKADGTSYAVCCVGCVRPGFGAKNPFQVTVLNQSTAQICSADLRLRPPMTTHDHPC